MSISYSAMRCRDCGTMIVPTVTTVTVPKTVKCHGDCYYCCPQCNVGYSNAQQESQRRKIFPHFPLNVPAKIRSGIEVVMPQALNVENRQNKMFKAAFETSEDAVTWTVFRYLQGSQQVAAALSLAGAEPTQIYYWGVPWPGAPTARLPVELTAILTELGEHLRCFTEPDVIVETDQMLAFVECKYTSGNKPQPHYRHFGRYLTGRELLFAASLDTVKAQGFYELTRNWVVGQCLARRLGKRFVLFNLAPESCRQSAEAFNRLINTSDNRYQFLTWKKLLAAPTAVPSWLTAYLASRPGLIEEGEL